MNDENPQLAPYAAVSLIFSALSNPARSAIVHRLTESPCYVGELVEHLELSQPLVSQHLKVLRQANLVQAVRHGRQSRYQLMDEHVTHLFLDALHHTHEHAAQDREEELHDDDSVES
ncbi:winged helix-turn-helix transcriptional regulator [Kocuria coralli]|uniref:Winged helix-turn-helix transcriptional regulator n=1 Tax=Kocuria coralli TaxID=1461025 RepID=A0A5J5KZ97_9MICC|nr:metalloregulator ArsR/SmtB family transcription factor [Kocuria coralli]KAA9394235.1 winged helix-turn-helix transcriptional regulator [Kocuria coralli]